MGITARGLLVAALLIGGCGREEAAQDETISGKKAAEPHPKKEWLGKLDTTTPGEWLAQHLAARGTGRSLRPASEIPVVLAGAGRVFGETPRMIVNRAVQLETMLSSQGADESALDLIADLSSTVATRGEAEGFGARCQQYYILRVLRRNTREQALMVLKRGEFRD